MTVLKKVGCNCFCREGRNISFVFVDTACLSENLVLLKKRRIRTMQETLRGRSLFIPRVGAEEKLL